MFLIELKFENNKKCINMFLLFIIIRPRMRAEVLLSHKDLMILIVVNHYFILKYKQYESYDSLDIL